MEKEANKIPSQLVERPRQETWWHGQDVIFPVPHYPDPVINDSGIALIIQNLFYCLDGNFDYALKWQKFLDTPIAMASPPQWFGGDKIVVAALLRDGRYQSLFFDLNSDKLHRYTIMKGEPYKDLYIHEDRYPLSPVIAKGKCVIIDPYGHSIVYPEKKRRTLGRKLRVRHQYQTTPNGQVIVHAGNKDNSWLELYNPISLGNEKISQKYPSVFGFTTGHCGSEPLITEDYYICGFGDRLICLDHDCLINWEFIFPQIDKREEGDPLTVLTNDGEVIYQSTSEVNITSNLHCDSEYLYFVLSECTRHVSFVTKISVESGKVIWTSRIDGYSGHFKIIETSSKGLLLQQSTILWIIAQDGSIRRESEIQIDCAGCSNLVRFNENRYVILADLGLHEAIINLNDFFVQPVIDTSGPKRRVFLSHASEDKDAIVRPFYEACEHNSISAWFDAAEIRWGDSLIGKIEDGLRKSQIVILFLSKHFLDKPWPKKELETAISMEINGQSVVLPLVLGLSHDELRRKHPLIASKLYRYVENYDYSQRVAYDVIDNLVRELEKITER